MKENETLVSIEELMTADNGEPRTRVRASFKGKHRRAWLTLLNTFPELSEEQVLAECVRCACVAVISENQGMPYTFAAPSGDRYPLIAQLKLFSKNR